MSPDRRPFKRGLGSPVLWGLVQSFIAGAFYFGLGLVSERAAGWTWVVYLAAALFFVLTVLSYIEGASLHQERGGATVIARYAFNELWSFVAGWAILLDYLILIALTAFAATNYLAVLWDPIGEGFLEFAVAASIIVTVAVINVRGLDPARFERFFYVALGDLALQIVMLVAGLALVLEPDVLTHPGATGGTPPLTDLVFAFTLAIVAFTALDASSGFSGQVAIGRRGLKRLITARTLSVLVAYVGLAIIASSVLATGAVLDRETPVVSAVDASGDGLLADALRYVVAGSAFFVLFTACVGAMLGLSRLGYSLAVNRQIPSLLGRLHPSFATPIVAIAVGTVLSLALLAPKDLEFLAAIYAFGATLAFTLVHLSVLQLRRREPSRDRPFRVPFDLKVGAVRLPIPTIVGLIASAVAFASVIALHDAGRIVGPIWMGFGIVLYVGYRRSQGKTLYHRVTVPETSLTHADTPAAQYGTILVPILGSPLDDDIVQTAGRLAVEERIDPEEGAQIEAMWVFPVPMTMPLDGRLPEGDLKQARAALARAKAVGEEYEGVEVNTFTTRARSHGQAIVAEARRRGVELIVMPAEEPTLVRGGVLLGGKQGLRDTFVGETTRFVINKAPCRVILTAPPDPGRPRRELPARSGRQSGPDPLRPARRAVGRLRPVKRHDLRGPRDDGHPGA